MRHPASENESVSGTTIPIGLAPGLSPRPLGPHHSDMARPVFLRPQCSSTALVDTLAGDPWAARLGARASQEPAFGGPLARSMVVRTRLTHHQVLGTGTSGMTAASTLVRSATILVRRARFGIREVSVIHKTFATLVICAMCMDPVTRAIGKIRVSLAAICMSIPVVPILAIPGICATWTHVPVKSTTGARRTTSDSESRGVKTTGGAQPLQRPRLHTRTRMDIRSSRPRRAGTRRIPPASHLPERRADTLRDRTGWNRRTRITRRTPRHRTSSHRISSHPTKVPSGSGSSSSHMDSVPVIDTRDELLFRRWNAPLGSHHAWAKVVAVGARSLSLSLSLSS